ncbi:PSD1 and planctomycete cytochrome C domain-containing protein [Botrimarina hoheduenensis]|uniref:Planctomycete cytochrome C n=1 Tax=Botrimarina hoheduenensis TaxID=2528000 RepID=A0A5C5W8K6_9BACT|nr:PSD1 and planctomycete cytochrome C domain-containing protein [Botrimarina hoheduenensis]TWT46797.1 Planctomycete cytochrome C [Botrimarina hoheduenensis]
MESCGNASRVVGGLCALATLLTAARIASADPSVVSYNRDVRPILSDKCFHCHGPDAASRAADLRLDVRDEAIAYGAIVPGDVAESLLLERINETDADLLMPPPRSHKTLSDVEKQTLLRWIEQGAEYQTHWAYQPIRRAPLPPAVSAEPSPQAPIDRFIQQRLSLEGITPSTEADRAALLRRLNLDLTGLPPTVEEVAAFVADQRPHAYAEAVERLLASPHYGERMAQPWLDVVRYADTVGFHGDQNQNAWPYRDYVIASFNNNKPFDEFTREQIAGDLLPAPTESQRIATCFNRLNMMTREGGAQPKEYLAIYNADRVRTVSMAWLGSTFGCAECHDHKFDPITQKDFYSLAAFFADVKQWGVYHDYKFSPNPDLVGWTNDHPFPPEIEVESPTLRERIKKYRAEIAEIETSDSADTARFAKWRCQIGKFLRDEPTGWATPPPQTKVPEDEFLQATITDEGQIAFGADGPQLLEVTLDPVHRVVAAFRITLPADTDLKAPLGRSIGDYASMLDVQAKWTLVEGEQATPLMISHAAANRSLPLYESGEQLMGVAQGWSLDDTPSDEPHTAVYFLDRPLRLSAGQSLRVHLTLGRVAINRLRIDITPLRSLEVSAQPLPGDPAEQIADDRTARAYYLRSDPNGWDPRLADLEREILAAREGKWPVMVTEHLSQPKTIRVLPRGDWQDESGEICVPALPSFLPRPRETEDHVLTRTDLAEWLCSEENPLTARVFVNRLWKQFFGTGLSAQADDFGAQGEAPSHPELLDWLASEFRRSGWDIKHLVRQIVMSHTYRQSSALRAEVMERDPHNRLLASQNPRRLEAEIVRDNALAIAGLINLERGGPPAKPYQPADYYAGLQFPDRPYVAETDERQYRRGVYMHWQRTFLHPMLANFDAPSREDCVAIRSVANSPQQALTLLNDPTFVEAARGLAARLIEEAPPEDASRVALGFRLAVAREPEPAETEGLLRLLDSARMRYASHPQEAQALLQIGLGAQPSEIAPAELAAWTNVARVVLNLHETITRY